MNPVKFNAIIHEITRLSNLAKSPVLVNYEPVEDAYFGTADSRCFPVVTSACLDTLSPSLKMSGKEVILVLKQLAATKNTAGMKLLEEFLEYASNTFAKDEIAAYRNMQASREAMATAIYLKQLVIYEREKKKFLKIWKDGTTPLAKLLEEIKPELKLKSHTAEEYILIGRIKKVGQEHSVPESTPWENLYDWFMKTNMETYLAFAILKYPRQLAGLANNIKSLINHARETP